jgi:CBS domain-containing protein
MTARRILDEKGGAVVSVRPADTVEQAAQTLSANNVGAVLVFDAVNAPIGVFSERDLMRAVARDGAAALSRPVSALMSENLVIARPNASFDDLMTLMTDRRVRHVIIMEGRALKGVVSIGDVVKRKIASAEAEAESLKAYIEGV